MPEAVRFADSESDAESPAESDIRVQVAQILSSPDFDVPDRAGKLLTYVVEETISGRADRLKAYSVATEVFGRSSSFDPQADPVVRIEASRVRRALERYYLTAGKDDPVVITIPKGGYVPSFAWRPNGSTQLGTHDDGPAALARSRFPRWPWAVALLPVLASAVAFGYWMASQAATGEEKTRIAPIEASGALELPRLLVLPFEDLSGSTASALIARGLTDEVIIQIAKFKDIVVLTRQPGEANANLRQLARYSLQGSLRTDADKLRLSVRLLNEDQGSVVWTNSYDTSYIAHELIQTEHEIARKVATAIAQPYGIVFQADAAPVVGQPPSDWDAYACTLAYYSYRDTLDPELHASVRQCLERAVERFPGYSSAWALLSLTYLDELRFGFRADAVAMPSIDRALDAARRAIELDPENVRGLQAQMTALFFKGDVDGALKIGVQAIAMNPNDTDLLGEYGLRLALKGEWKRGAELMARALERNPRPSGYYETGLALSSYMQRDYHAAVSWTRKADLGANSIYHAVAAAVFGQAGETVDAAIERNWLIKNAPLLLNEIEKELAVRNIGPEDQAHFVDGLRKAGLVITGF